MGRSRNRRSDPPRNAGTSSRSRMGEALRNELWDWAREAAEASGVCVFDLDASSGWQITLYIERPNRKTHDDGVTVDECIRVSRYLETLLDADDRVPERYRLDVSSPGIERRIRSPHQLELSIGRLLRVVLQSDEDGKDGAVVQGTLLSYEDEELVLACDDSNHITIRWADIARAKLTFEF